MKTYIRALSLVLILGGAIAGLGFSLRPVIWPLINLDWHASTRTTKKPLRPSKLPALAL